MTIRGRASSWDPSGSPGRTRPAPGRSFGKGVALPSRTLPCLPALLLVCAALAAGADEVETALVPVPGDPAAGSPRPLLVLVHGYDSSHARLPFDPARDRTWEPLRARPELAALRARYELHEFHWRPWAALPAQGAALAEALAARPGLPLVLVGHSAGGLISRYAAADPRLADRVVGIVTLATPHWGSGMASILFAGKGARRRLGWARYALLARGRGAEPDTPALRSLAAVDHASRLSHLPLEAWGVRLNPELAAFNEADPNIGKIIAYQGRVTRLWTRGRGGLEAEARRRILGAFCRVWADADPLVDLASGSFAGRPVAARRLLPGLEHGEIVRHPVALGLLCEDLAALARAARAAVHRAGAPP